MYNFLHKRSLKASKKICKSMINIFVKPLKLNLCLFNGIWWVLKNLSTSIIWKLVPENKDINFCREKMGSVYLAKAMASTALFRQLRKNEHNVSYALRQNWMCKWRTVLGVQFTILIPKGLNGQFLPTLFWKCHFQWILISICQKNTALIKRFLITLYLRSKLWLDYFQEKCK